MSTVQDSGVAPATPPSAQPAPASRKNSRLRPVIIGLVAIGVIAWLGHAAWHAWHHEETDDAYIVGHIHQISPQISARVKDVLVDDNQTVTAGTPLLRLDAEEFEIGVQKARATLAQAKGKAVEANAAIALADAQIATARARLEQAEAQVGQTQAQLELATLNFSRNEKLSVEGGGAITQADMDAFRSARQNAAAAHAASLANLSASRAGVTAAEATRHSAEAAVGTAEANIAVEEAALKDAARELAYTLVTAPSAGRIGNKSVETGARVQAGQVLFALAEPDVWITANFKETQLANIREGQAVDITVDAIPGQALHGKIDSISPASGAQFALLPPDNATGNFNKIVQRVPVKIVLDAESMKIAGERLRLGFSVVVTVRVR